MEKTDKIRRSTRYYRGVPDYQFAHVGYATEFYELCFVPGIPANVLKVGNDVSSKSCTLDSIPDTIFMKFLWNILIFLTLTLMKGLSFRHQLLALRYCNLSS